METLVQTRRMMDFQNTLSLVSRTVNDLQSRALAMLGHDSLESTSVPCNANDQADFAPFVEGQMLVLVVAEECCTLRIES